MKIYIYNIYIYIWKKQEEDKRQSTKVYTQAVLLMLFSKCVNIYDSKTKISIILASIKLRYFSKRFDEQLMW